MSDEVKYKMRVVRGAFVRPEILDTLGAQVIRTLKNDLWISIEELTVTREEIKKLQELMVRHFTDPTVPWYMDGYRTDDKEAMVVAFGVDDGEGGKAFYFRRTDEVEIKKVVDYGVSKGIPPAQMDFSQVDF